MSDAGAPDIASQRKEEATEDQRLEEEENAYLLEFTEAKPPESMKVLDKKLDELNSDISLLLDSRTKDFQNTPGRKDRLPILPDINEFEGYKEFRKQKLEEAVRVQMPSRGLTSSGVISNQVPSFPS